MKITIWWSMTFAKEQFEAKEFLEKKWHTILVSDDIEHFIDNPNKKHSQSFEEELKFCLESDIMRLFYNKINESDAFLVCNYPKKWIDWYLGTSVLMELAIAYFTNKKVFLLFNIDKTQSYALEVNVFNPIILNWDLSKIK